ncbi:uncharacterized protein LOC117644503 [Thrips palmi]|uniref:Uncharacterized protein LOC117644503 n=1 Tax=Thrips palmi TaxID=161013 RepID=A0A6P8YRF7_THRPL|nr:uncharacterized protein LOC117644503 [Thrips palmi]
MVSCAIRHCRNTPYLRKIDPTKRHLRFFLIPKSKSTCELTAKRFKKRQDLWLQAINRPEITAEMIQKGKCYVCSDHFISGSPSNKYLEDSEDWIPTKNLHTTPEPVQAADENGSNANDVQNDEQESTFMDSSSSMLNSSGFHPLEESLTDMYDTCHENVSVEFQTPTSSTQKKTPTSATQRLQDRLTDCEVDTCHENVSVEFQRPTSSTQKETPTSATQRLQDRLTDCEVDIQELLAKNEKLEKENEDLKEELAALKERLYEEIMKRRKIERESSVKMSKLARQITTK